MKRTQSTHYVFNILFYLDFLCATQIFCYLKEQLVAHVYGEEV